MEFADGTVRQVYCHWDGYLDHNGKLLLNHYTDLGKVQALISNGQISSLRKEIGEKHSFDQRYDVNDERRNWTTYYGRDRGETDVSYTTYTSFDDYLTNSQSEEYDYIMRADGQWHVRFYDTPMTLLVDAIAAEMIERELSEEE
jgi:hypothetical protein